MFWIYNVHVYNAQYTTYCGNPALFGVRHRAARRSSHVPVNARMINIVKKSCSYIMIQTNQNVYCKYLGEKMNKISTAYPCALHTQFIFYCCCIVYEIWRIYVETINKDPQWKWEWRSVSGGESHRWRPAQFAPWAQPRTPAKSFEIMHPLRRNA
jgi:hypothetical protein